MQLGKLIRHFCWQARDSHLYCFGLNAGNTLFISCHSLLAVAILIALISTLNLTSCAYSLLVSDVQIVYTSGNMLDSAIIGLKIVTTLSTVLTIWFALYMV